MFLKCNSEGEVFSLDFFSNDGLKFDSVAFVNEILLVRHISVAVHSRRKYSSLFGINFEWVLHQINELGGIF